jgi:glucokinase
MANVMIGVDLGGTQMRVARYDSQFNLLERQAELTLAEEGPDRMVPRLLDLIARVMPEDLADIDGIGVSVPGPINPHAGTIVHPPNLPGCNDLPIRKMIQERFGCTTYLGNDANVAALAEATRGAAHGYKYVIYLTISTGIGGGIIDNGRLLVGSQGLGAEAGHMMMVVNDEIMDLEQAASGTGIARRAMRLLRDGAQSRIRDLVNGQLDHITAKTVGDAAQAGDKLAVELIGRAGFMIGLGIVSLLHLFNPQIIVVGGSVTKTGDLLFKPMRQAVEKHVLDAEYCQNLPIVTAALGDDVALVGAAALVQTRGGSYIGP